jgi:50S ribosomal protein L16 3-hydroxylase
VTALLGGLDPATFLRRHWQKRPLLVRQALPGFAGILDRDDLLALANRADATSRLIIEHPRRKKRWERHDGPFLGLEAATLPSRAWTLLVHGVESLVPGGWELLRHFNFIPAARIDDLMVSYAADGGSVGPHDDRYDVFLLQGPGRRRWKVQTGGKRVVDEGAGIRVLADFRAEEDWLLEPGDMLYLPPGVAHHGVAEGPCFTYSIGFLAPTHRELVQQFLGYLAPARAAALDEAALLTDPDLRPARRPLAIGDAMLTQVAGVLEGIRWDEGDVADFLGRFLTLPRPHARFEPPRRPLSGPAFARRLRGGGRGRLVAALPTRGLVHGKRLFLNGVAHTVDRATQSLFEKLVDDRALALPLAAVSGRAAALLHEAYVAGHLAFSQREGRASGRAGPRGARAGTTPPPPRHRRGL